MHGVPSLGMSLATAKAVASATFWTLRLFAKRFDPSATNATSAIMSGMANTTRMSVWPLSSRHGIRSLISALPTTSMTGKVDVFKGWAALCAVQRLNTTLALSALVESWQ